jgi:hypothetical protein
MTHEEFFSWLDGFLTNRDWDGLNRIDIDTIKNKMSEVSKSKKINFPGEYGLPNLKKNFQTPIIIEQKKDD